MELPHCEHQRKPQTVLITSLSKEICQVTNPDKAVKFPLKPLQNKSIPAEHRGFTKTRPKLKGVIRYKYII